MAGRAVPEPALGVDVLAILLVPDAGAAAAGDHQLIVLHTRHVGERMPQPAHRVDDTSVWNRLAPPPWASASGCHSTPTQKRRVGSSSPSMMPSPSARAATTSPSPTRSAPRWWWE